MASPSTDGRSIIEFLGFIGKLKSLKRTGWMRYKVPDPESVASHMYRMAIMTFYLEKDSTLNKDRCMKLALVHDMAECIVGDITPIDGVSKEEKHRQEKEAMQHLSTLAGPEVGKEFYDLWEEYENQQTPESRVVKDIDRFDMILQAHSYETEQTDRGPFLQEFFDSTDGKFSHPTVKYWVDELKEIRTKLLTDGDANDEKS